MTSERPQPELDRLSTLAALLLLTFGLVRIIDLPSTTFDLTALGLVVSISINSRSIMLALAVALSVVGADWLAQTHPRAPGGRRAIERWILPCLAAIGIGTLLTRIPEGPGLWLALVLAAAVLMTVFLAEFVAIDPEDRRRPVAAVGLEALSYLLLLELAFSLRLLGVRAIFAVPAQLLAGTATAWRLLRLRQPSRRVLAYGVVIGWGLAQMDWGLHYLPLLPLQGALLLTLFFYLGVGASGAILSGDPLSDRLPEYGVVCLLGLAAILGLA